MLDFVYYSPTKVAFGRDVEKQAGPLIREFGGSKVLIHYGSDRVNDTGLMKVITDSLEAAGLSYVKLGGAVPNPRLSKVYEGIALCREHEVDFILAVGGGSVIDSSKAIGYGVVHDFDIWDLYDHKRVATSCLPIGSVLTISSAGSEMSASSVITRDEDGAKRGYSSDFARCRFALMNPALTIGLPWWQTASGCVDILMHTMERYFVREQASELTDSLAEALMRTVMHYSLILKDCPDDYDARAEIMWASSLSHNDLTGSRAQGDWACHQLEHELSGMFDITHGAGLAAIWGSWARYVYKDCPGRFARFAVNVAGCVSEGRDDSVIALKGIERMEQFFKQLGMPLSLSEMGLELTMEQCEELAWKCSFGNTRTVGGIKELSLDDMKAVYELASKGY